MDTLDLLRSPRCVWPTPRWSHHQKKGQCGSVVMFRDRVCSLHYKTIWILDLYIRDIYVTYINIYICIDNTHVLCTFAMIICLTACSNRYNHLHDLSRYVILHEWSLNAVLLDFIWYLVVFPTWTASGWSLAYFLSRRSRSTKKLVGGLQRQSNHIPSDETWKKHVAMWIELGVYTGYIRLQYFVCFSSQELLGPSIKPRMFDAVLVCWKAISSWPHHKQCQETRRNTTHPS